jgi:hypothetical protein
MRQEYLFAFMISVFAELAARAIVNHAYPGLGKSLKRALGSCFLAASKICSFFKALSFGVAKRRVTRFVGDAVQVVVCIVCYCFWTGMLLYAAHDVLGGSRKSTEQLPFRPVSIMKHCPTRNNIYSTATLEPESWPDNLPRSNCTRPCGGTPTMRSTSNEYGFVDDAPQ